MPDAPKPFSHEILKSRQRLIRDTFPDNISIRIHRALSWLKRSEVCEDYDGRFLFLWIAFNAAYADDREPDATATNARDSFRDYFDRMVALDGEQVIYKALWERFPGPIRVLMGSRYVYSPFWKYHNGNPKFENWERMFQGSTRDFNQAFQNGDTAKLLSFLFDRLYVLRNQLMHGGATWDSSVNRDMVRNGANILSFLVPRFIDLMMSHPNEDWGLIAFYPTVD